MDGVVGRGVEYARVISLCVILYGERTQALTLCCVWDDGGGGVLRMMRVQALYSVGNERWGWCECCGGKKEVPRLRGMV